MAGLESRKNGKAKQADLANLIMPAARPVITSTVPEKVLGKRKTQEYVIRLTSSPEPPTDSDSNPSSRPILVNGVLVEKTKKRYKCTFSSCDKAYTKPSRLAEHERSHTGEVCRIHIFKKKSTSPEQLLTAAVRL